MIGLSCVITRKHNVVRTLSDTKNDVGDHKYTYRTSFAVTNCCVRGLRLRTQIAVFVGLFAVTNYCVRGPCLRRQIAAFVGFVCDHELLCSWALFAAANCCVCGLRLRSQIVVFVGSFAATICCVFGHVCGHKLLCANCGGRGPICAHKWLRSWASFVNTRLWTSL